MTLALVVAFALCGEVSGHGHMLSPPSRQGGTVAMAGQCWQHGQCYWFSQPAAIPGKPTLPDYARTFNMNVTSGPKDWTRKMPWRAPGTAPVYGSGCGTAGGGPRAYPNGGAIARIIKTFAKNVKQGDDSLDALPPLAKPTVWKRGGVEEAIWSMHANHGGGYSYRLCNKKETISEECFQRTVLNMSGDTQTYQIEDDESTRVEIPRVSVTEGTYPPGSMWARVPIPACDVAAMCAVPDAPQKRESLGCPYANEPGCPVNPNGCAGVGIPGAQFGKPKTFTCPAVQFPPPFPDAAVGFGGFGWPCIEYQMAVVGLPWNIIDKVQVPADIEAGEYQLSWRYDTEQSTQVWQTCADITIADSKIDAFEAPLRRFV
jgi:hypothetical protein